MKARIIIEPGRHYCDGGEFTSVDFWGHNEGEHGGVDANEVDAKVQRFIKQYSSKYDIEIIDRRIKQETLF